MFRLLALHPFYATSALAQLSFGFLGGVPFNDLTNGKFPSVAVIGPAVSQTFAVPFPVFLSTSYNGSRYTLGPTVQLGLPHGFRLEGDALYRRLGIPSQTTAQWRFPLLVQYRISVPFS